MATTYLNEKLHWWCHLVKFTLASPSPVLLATTPPNERGPLEADLDRHARLTILYLVDKKSFVVISPTIVIYAFLFEVLFMKKSPDKPMTRWLTTNLQAGKRLSTPQGRPAAGVDRE